MAVYLETWENLDNWFKSSSDGAILDGALYPVGFNPVFKYNNTVDSSFVASVLITPQDDQALHFIDNAAFAKAVAENNAVHFYNILTTQFFQVIFEGGGTHGSWPFGTFVGDSVSQNAVLFVSRNQGQVPQNSLANGSTDCANHTAKTLCSFVPGTEYRVNFGKKSNGTCFVKIFVAETSVLLAEHEVVVDFPPDFDIAFCLGLGRSSGSEAPHFGRIGFNTDLSDAEVDEKGDGEVVEPDSDFGGDAKDLARLIFSAAPRMQPLSINTDTEKRMLELDLYPYLQSVGDLVDVVDKFGDDHLEQFKNSPIVRAITSAYLMTAQQINGTFNAQLFNNRSIETAEGKVLDDVASIVGAERLGKTDPQLRQEIYFCIAKNKTSGEGNFVIRFIKRVTGSDSVITQEHFPARFSAQFSSAVSSIDFASLRAQVKKITAMGVGFDLINYDSVPPFVFAAEGGVENLSGAPLNELNHTEAGKPVGGPFAELI